MNYQQTGYQYGQPGGMLPQRTGYPGGPPQQMGGGFTGMQPMQTGMMPQPTGMPGGMYGGIPPPQQQRQPPPMPPMPSAGGGGNYSFLSAPPPTSQFQSSGLTAQRTGYPGQNPMQPQQTGYGGGMLTAQPTGMPHDPRLQMMMGSFMPGAGQGLAGGGGNSSFSSQFPSIQTLSAQLPGISPQQPLSQNFRSLLQNPEVATPKVAWALSRQEKKDYDQIFKAWTGGSGGGFIDGGMAQEVFGQSGLGREDLGKIWNLADVNNRGKLNLPEFHVAMGLIYRALNGNTIPDDLPAEMVPPSMRDIDSTVDFVKDLLRNDTSARSTPGIDDLPGTFGARGKADATVYKHDDTRAKGYQSSSRHLDRKAVRYDGEDADAELSDIKRQLENSSSMLDRSAKEFESKTREDEELEQEVEDLKYRVKRVKDDIEYVSRGKRTPEKDEERRKLERELLHLMHERLPEVERKQQAAQDRRRREEREGVRARDKRNETYGRYDGDYGRSNYDRERDNGDYRRGSRDRSRERSRDRDAGYDRERRPSREYDSYSSRRPITPPARRSPPPSAPRVPESNISAPPPAPAPPTTRTAAPSTAGMSAEEKTAFIRAQAQAKIQARLRALGMATADSEPAAGGVDNSVQERIEREKKEAEEKTKQAERDQEEREAKRKARLEGAGGSVVKEEPKAPTPAAAPIKSALKRAPAPPPPGPKKNAPAPPPSKATVVPRSFAPPPPADDDEDEELKAREEAQKKRMAERAARLKKMEEEEEQARREEEEFLQKKKDAAAARAKQLSQESSAASAPPAPPATTNVASPAASGSSYNPFHRAGGAAAAAVVSPTPQAKGGFNPFFKPTAPAAAEGSAAPPAPVMPVAAPKSVPKPAYAPPEEEWDAIAEKDDSDDSSDDEYNVSRSQRANIAQALFGGSSTPRPGSAGAGPASPRPTSAGPSAALSKLGGGDPMARGGLFAAIQGGAKLRKAQTVEKGVDVGGKVVGDAAPPAHISAVAREHTPPPQRAASPPPAPAESVTSDKTNNRQSVDWYAGLASEADGPGTPKHTDTSPMPSMAEEEEEPVSQSSNGHAVDGEDPLAEFDMSHTIRVRTLYPYEGQRDLDLSFPANIVLEANKAKDASSPWWYGVTVKDKNKGWFPSSYVDELQPTKAKALYSYTGNSDEELPFMEGDILSIVDQSESDWWKAEKAGVIFIVPASYLETYHATAVAAALVPAPRLIAPILGTPKEMVDSPADLGPPTPSKPDQEDDDSSDDDSYLSFDDEEDKKDDAAEKERREKERLRVLQAAGLQLKREPPGVPVRRPAIRSRRPPPSAPLSRNRNSVISMNSVTSESRTIPSTTLTPPPDKLLPSVSPQLQTDDAYDRYESYLEQARTRPPVVRARSHSDALPPTSAARPVSMMSTMSVSPRMEQTSFGSSSQTSLQLPKESTGGKISGFMSRMLAQPTPERRSLPIISGPISVTPVPSDQGEERSTTPSFGQTWSSLVDAGVLETMSDQERKRQEAIFELIATESAYVRDLQLIVEVFYATMLEMLDEKALTVIFANVEDILLFNTTLLSSLEERQKASRLYVNNIGDILFEQLSSLAVYMPYCVNQAQGIKLLQTLRQNDPVLSTHLQEIRSNNPSVRSLDLSSFLLIPMQRLTRYPLLIRQILHYTSPSQDAPLLKRALEAAEGVVAGVNESVRENEGGERLKALSEDLWIGGEGRLDLTAPTALQGPRRLIKEGTVMKAKSGRKLQMVLCNDIVVLIDSRNLYRMPMPLHEVTVKEIPRDSSSFSLTQQYQKGGDSINLKSSSAKEATTWISEINTARRKALEAREQVARRHSRSYSGAGGY